MALRTEHFEMQSSLPVGDDQEGGDASSYGEHSCGLRKFNLQFASLRRSPWGRSVQDSLATVVRKPESIHPGHHCSEGFRFIEKMLSVLRTAKDPPLPACLPEVPPVSPAGGARESLSERNQDAQGLNHCKCICTHYDYKCFLNITLKKKAGRSIVKWWSLLPLEG